MKFTANLDKFGIIGLFIAVLVSPCCFPLFGFVLSALGLGSAELFGGWTKYIFQAFLLVSLAGIFLSYRKHKNIFPLLIGLISGVLIVYAYNFRFNDVMIYTGMFGLLVSAGLNYYFAKRNKAACAVCESESTIACPECGYRKKETMPANACVYFYECTNCKAVLKPKPGDCCVFCSYGTVKCPPMQAGHECC